MIAIRADESPTPIVERIAELSHSGHRLRAAADRVESKIAAADIDGRTVGDCPLLRCPGSKRGLSPLAFRIVRRPDPAALLTVGNVDSVVQSEQWIADSQLRIARRESVVQRNGLIRATDIPRVAEPNNPRRRRHDQAVAPGHESRWQTATCRRIRNVARNRPVPSRSSSSRMRPSGGLPRRRTVGIVEHLHDEHPPVLVEGHGHRALHIRLGRHKFDFQALRQNELALRLRRRKRA